LNRAVFRFNWTLLPLLRILRALNGEDQMLNNSASQTIAQPDPADPVASQAIDAVIAARKHLPGALMPILHGIQDVLGFIPAQAAEPIAKALNLSRAEVHGVVTYYHYFRSTPPGQHVVQICRAEACQAMGAEALWAHACTQLDCNGHEHGHGTSKNGAFTLEPVYCLGLCAQSPAMTLDDKLHARVGIDKFNRLLAQTGSAA
jgi:formate dehydrogenase subunit gamma